MLLNIEKQLCRFTRKTYNPSKNTGDVISFIVSAVGISTSVNCLSWKSRKHTWRSQSKMLHCWTWCVEKQIGEPYNFVRTAVTILFIDVRRFCLLSLLRAIMNKILMLGSCWLDPFIVYCNVEIPWHAVLCKKRYINVFNYASICVLICSRIMSDFNLTENQFP